MVEELLPDLYLIKIPLPGSPLGWVNSYVIKGIDRNLVIDTGLNRKSASKRCMPAWVKSRSI